MTGRRIAILGAGNGGYTAAADLSMRGHRCVLYEFPEYESNLKVVRERGKIRITFNLLNLGEAPHTHDVEIAASTTSVEEALGESDIVLVVMPAFGHARLATLCGPHLRSRHHVVLVPGSMFGAFAFRKVALEAGAPDSFHIAETATLPYNTRLVAPGEVQATHVKRLLLGAALPSKHTGVVLGTLSELFPAVRACSDTLEVGLNNGNPIAHVPAVVLNAGRIETAAGDFFLFKDGITPSVVRVHEAADEERLQICEALGYRRYRTADRMFDAGDSQTNATLLEAYKSAVFLASQGPSSLQTRYLSEDVPYGVIPWLSLADLCGLATPTLHGLVHLVEILHGKSYWDEARTLAKLGLAGLTSSRLKHVFQ
jgi:opine dehydrogenase